MRVRSFALLALYALGLALFAPASAHAISITTSEIAPTPVTGVSGFNFPVIPISGGGVTDTTRGVASFSLTFDLPVDAYVKIGSQETKYFEVTDATTLEFSLSMGRNGLQDERNTIQVFAADSTAGTPSGNYGTLQTTYIVFLDRVAPNPPGGITAEGADEIILVEWDAPSKSGTEFFDQYIITYSETDFSTQTEEQAKALTTKTVDAVGGNEATIDGLENGTTYYVSVRTIDWAGNVSAFPKNESGGILTTSAQPVITLSLSELAGEKGGCFIATAAYGSYQEPHVQVLRQFRDRILLRSAAGEQFVAWYYRVSPAYALWIAKHDAARTAARLFLLPLYAFAYLLLHPLWILLAGMLLAGIGAARYALPRREVA